MRYAAAMPTTTAPLPVPVPERAWSPVPAETDWRQLAGAWLLEYPSVHTQDAYRRDLQQWADYCAHTLGGTDPLKASRPWVTHYARHLDTLDLAPSTRARKLAAVASFYAYAVAAGSVAANPAAGVHRPRVPNESPRLGLDREAARRVIAAAEAATAAHRALIALCLGAGLRVSEALAVTPADLTTVRGHQVVTVTGKGGKARSVPLSPQALALLSAALEGCPADTPVVRTDTGELIDRHRALRMVEALGRRAGVGHRLRPHDLRHTAATLSLDGGAPIHRVQDLLGHSSPTTTTRYVQHRERLDHSAAYVLGTALAAD